MVMALCVGLNKLPLSLSFRKIDSAWWLTEPSALQHGIHSIFFSAIFATYPLRQNFEKFSADSTLKNMVNLAKLQISVAEYCKMRKR